MLERRNLIVATLLLVGLIVLVTYAVTRNYATSVAERHYQSIRDKRMATAVETSYICMLVSEAIKKSPNQPVEILALQVLFPSGHPRVDRFGSPYYYAWPATIGSPGEDRQRQTWDDITCKIDLPEWQKPAQ